MRILKPSAIQRKGHKIQFLRHLLEMTIAMVLGMVVLGAAFRQIHLAVFGSGFDDLWHRHTELAAFAMAFNMTLPMVAWMRHRGHSWERGGEMAAAMSLPALPLLALLWLGVISAHLVLPLQMALMLPSMIAVMLYRRDEYTGHLHASAGTASDRTSFDRRSRPETERALGLPKLAKRGKS